VTAKTVEFYFDFGSPAAYLAWTQLAGLPARIDYRPVLLGGVFQATGNKSPMEVPAKGRYMLADLERYAHRYGVPFVQNPHFPINTLQLMRGAVALQLGEPARFDRYVEAVFNATWARGENMNDPATLGRVLQAAEFDVEALLGMAADPQVKDRLKSATQEAVERGVFGAPTFFVGGHMYWGQDRLDFVKEALR
jgi:2-hydroxychromene-2-carboxylate isomerase